MSSDRLAPLFSVVHFQFSGDCAPPHVAHMVGTEASIDQTASIIGGEVKATQIKVAAGQNRGIIMRPHSLIPANGLADDHFRFVSLERSQQHGNIITFQLMGPGVATGQIQVRAEDGDGPDDLLERAYTEMIDVLRQGIYELDMLRNVHMPMPTRSGPAKVQANL